MDKWKDFANRWHTDYDFKTFVNSFGSALVTLAFAIFNFVLGIKRSSPWHISIDLSADITANAYGGTGVQNTGTTGDNTTYLGSMEISWK